MNKKKLNIGCGDTFINDISWINIDIDSNSKDVISHNILKDIPFSNESFDFIYTSHFIEHIPLEKIDFFFRECSRVLKKGGYIRIVTPDLEEMCQSYIHYKQNNKKKKEFVSIEIIDQLVRKKKGGKLKEIINNYLENKDQEMINFINSRTGYFLKKKSNNNNVSNSIILKLKKKLTLMYIKLILSFLPDAFKSQNVSLTDIGENHTWIWDFDNIKEYLIKYDFNCIEKKEFNTTQVDFFSPYELDVFNQDIPRKGLQSMFIEAKKK